MFIEAAYSMGYKVAYVVDCHGLVLFMVAYPGSWSFGV
jgi:hypothetical protein